MTRQEATTVLAVPLAEVESTVCDVARWPAFLTGLESVEATGFERYRFTVTDGGRRTVDVCVVPHPAEHRISWRGLSGPRYTGEWRLHAVDAGHTRVDLTMTADPHGMAAGFRELLGERHPTAQLCLHRLDGVVRGGAPAAGE